MITLDLLEADEGHRDALRHQLDESFRTVLGHLRHEVGHYYWARLVGQSDYLGGFRQIFGDERVNYRDTDVADAVRAMTKGAGVDRIVEVDFAAGQATAREDDLCGVQDALLRVRRALRLTRSAAGSYIFNIRHLNREVA